MLENSSQRGRRAILRSALAFTIAVGFLAVPLAAAWTSSTFNFIYASPTGGLTGSASGSGCGPAQCGPNGGPSCTTGAASGSILGTHTVGKIDFCVDAGSYYFSGGNASQAGYVTASTDVWTWNIPNSTTGLSVTADGKFYDSRGLAIHATSVCHSGSSSETGRVYLVSRMLLYQVGSPPTLVASTSYKVAYDTGAQDCSGGSWNVGDAAGTNIGVLDTATGVSLSHGQQYYGAMEFRCFADANTIAFINPATSISSECGIPGDTLTYVAMNSLTIV